jgi:methionine-rich copper-binding protein CopC
MATQRVILVIAGFAVLTLSAVVTASAHPRVVSATPAVGGTAKTAPSEVTIRFNEKLERAFSSVVVRDSAGKQVDKGDGAVDKQDRLVMRVSLQPLPPGTYKVEWRAVAADGHKVIGDFTFQVSEQGAGMDLPRRMVWLTR